MQCLLTNEFLFFFLYMKPDFILSFFFSFFHLTIIENFSNSEYLGTKLSSIIIEKNLYYSSHFLHFLDSGTLGNAGKAPDKGLATKLRPLVKALRDSDKLVQEAATELDAMEWDASKLCRGGGDAPTPTNGPPSTILPPAQPDPLDQLIACARALTEDVRQVASFIQVNIQRNHAFWLGTIEKKRTTIYIYIQNYRIFGIQLFLHRSL